MAEEQQGRVRGASERRYLDVPYAEKDQAKALGARWEPEALRWWVDAAADPEPFRRWWPAELHLGGVAVPARLVLLPVRCHRCAGDTRAIVGVLVPFGTDLGHAAFSEVDTGVFVEFASCADALVAVLDPAWLHERAIGALTSRWSRSAADRRVMNGCVRCGAPLRNFSLWEELVEFLAHAGTHEDLTEAVPDPVNLPVGALRAGRDRVEHRPTPDARVSAGGHDGLSTFGARPTRQGMERVRAALADIGRLLPTHDLEGEADRLAARLGQDLGAVRAAGRFDDDTPSPPNEFEAGDALALRMLASSLTLGTAAAAAPLAEAIGERPDDAEALSDAQCALSVAKCWRDAVPYFVPAADAVGIIGSRPPEEALRRDLRLPFPAVAVFFGTDLQIPPELWRVSPSLRAELASLLEERARDLGADGGRVSAEGWSRPDAARWVAEASARATYLTGVLLLADEDGRPGPVAAYLVARDAGAGEPYRTSLEGLVAEAALGPLVANLAAAVAWGDWHPPERPLELPPDAASRQWHRAIRAGTDRRQDQHGAATGVHVLDTSRMARPARATLETSHRSPVTHERRGHWRAQRVGPRHDWHYEARWIPWVVVNPGGEDPSDRNVYRLPVPPPSSGDGDGAA